MPKLIPQRPTNNSNLEGIEFDLCVIGGGIHGASVARDAALRGYKVLLLEKNDFSSGTSSRSSKMLHGGIRYLEQANFGLVKAALQERNYYLNAAPHLSRIKQFYFPILSKRSRSALLTRIGLGLYDLLSKISGIPSDIPPHGVVDNNNSDLHSLLKYGLRPQKTFSYYDGQMDDARLVVETVVDAKQLGAVVLNYAEVKQASRESDRWAIEFQDKYEGKPKRCVAKVVVNVAGPWAVEVAQIFGVQEIKAHFSRGTHLLFARKWDHPGLILPTKQKGRYYFVWPYFSPFSNLTLVGTTDVELSSNEESPEATKIEIAELLSLLKEDLPNAGLNAGGLIRSFAGVRILGKSDAKGWKSLFVKSSSSVSDVSREEIIQIDDKFISLIGGKYTSARKTAEQIVDTVDEMFSVSKRKIVKRRKTIARPLPGGIDFDVEQRAKAVTELEQLNLSRGIDQATSKLLAKRAGDRFGMLCKALLKIKLPESTYDPSALPCMPEELAYCLQEEFVLCQQDLLRRRLGLTLEDVNLDEISRLLDQWKVLEAIEPS